MHTIIQSWCHTVYSSIHTVFTNWTVMSRENEEWRIRNENEEWYKRCGWGQVPSSSSSSSAFITCSLSLWMLSRLTCQGSEVTLHDSKAHNYTSCTFNRSLRSPISIFSLRWALLRAARQRDSRSLSVVYIYMSWLVSHDYHMILQSMPGSCRTAGTICLGDVNRWYIVFVGSVNTC